MKISHRFPASRTNLKYVITGLGDKHISYSNKEVSLPITFPNKTVFTFRFLIISGKTGIALPPMILGAPAITTAKLWPLVERAATESIRTIFRTQRETYKLASLFMPQSHLAPSEYNEQAEEEEIQQVASLITNAMNDCDNSMQPENIRAFLQQREEFISEELRPEIVALLDKFQRVFHPTLHPEGASVEPFDIELVPGSAPLKNIPPRRIPPALLLQTQRAIQELLDHGVIKSSTSSTTTPIVIVPKKSSGTVRIAVDYRNLNKITVAYPYPMPHIKELLESLQGNKYFAVMDLRQGYHQFLLTPRASALSAFSCPFGLYQWTRMPEGLRNAGAYFQAAITNILKGLIGTVCNVYIDDIIIYGKDASSFLANLEAVLQVLNDNNMQVKLDKCQIGLKEVTYLGHTCSQAGISITSSRKDAIINIATPRNLQELRHFIGMTNYISSFIKDYARIVTPLSRMTTPSVKFFWSDECQQAFNNIKDAIVAAPLLHYVNPDLKLFCRTDASIRGLGAMIYQLDTSGAEIPLAFTSKAFNATQANWTTTEQELFAVVFALIKFEHFLRGRRFTLQTDHRNLLWMVQSTIPKIQRWSLAIQEFDFEISHIAGNTNIVADSLSRLVNNHHLPDTAVTGIDSNVINTDLDAKLSFVPTIPDHLLPTILSSISTNNETLEEEIDWVSKTHNSVTGHLGIQATLELLKSEGISWPGMYTDVVNYIHNCPICGINKTYNKTIPQEFKSLSVFEPAHTWSVDTLGPLPLDDNGKQFILVCVDHFTRTTELFPIRSTSAADAAPCLLELFSRYGAPRFLRSDNGTQYVNKLIKEFLLLVGTTQSLTLPYHPQANLAERVNKEIMKHLRALTLERRIDKNWSVYLPIIRRILNATVHSATGFSPSYLLYGGRVDLTRSLIQQHQQSTPQINPHSYIRDMLIQYDLLEMASAVHLAKQRDDRHKQSPLAFKFPAQSLVLIKYPTGRPDKLSSEYASIARVISQTGNNITCQDLLEENEIITYPMERLVPWTNNNSNIITDQQACETIKKTRTIENIIDHKGSIHHKTKLFFLVQWLGLPPTEATWESHRNLLHSPALLTYMDQHPHIHKKRKQE
jgi:hypothetical protein